MTALRPGLAPPRRQELAGTQEDSYLEGTVEQLFALLVDVLRARQPEIQAVFGAGLDSLDADRDLLLRALQTQGIWLQLLRLYLPRPSNNWHEGFRDFQWHRRRPWSVLAPERSPAMSM